MPLYDPLFHEIFSLFEKLEHRFCYALFSTRFLISQLFPHLFTNKMKILFYTTILVIKRWAIISGGGFIEKLNGRHIHFHNIYLKNLPLRPLRRTGLSTQELSNFNGPGSGDEVGGRSSHKWNIFTLKLKPLSLIRNWLLSSALCQWTGLSKPVLVVLWCQS